MAIVHHFSKPALLSILVLALCTSTFAKTTQSPTCEIQGDPDIYGIGIRCSFYLQWASLIITLLFCPREAGSQRAASLITTLAVYINTFNNMRQGSLVAFDYPLLWNLTSSLSFFNWPVTSVESEQHGGSFAMAFIVWAMYYLAGPWVFFKGLQVGRQPGCDIKYVIYVPISVYSKGLSTLMKVFSVVGVIYAILLLITGIGLGLVWLESLKQGADVKGDKAKAMAQDKNKDKDKDKDGDKDKVKGEDKDESDKSRLLATMQFIVGAFTIAFTERALTANRITFPDTHIADSGQLIPLLIGIFTFTTSVINAMRAIFTARRSRRDAAHANDIDAEQATQSNAEPV
jgi:hypothetical protein